MRKSIGSRNQYLILAGLIGVLSNLGPLLRGVAAIQAPMLATNVALAFCYLLLGARYRLLLATAPRVVFRLFHITIAWSVACFCWAYLVGDEGRAASGAILGGLLASHLLVTVRRILATEVVEAGG
jgi:hypothetical protein